MGKIYSLLVYLIYRQESYFAYLFGVREPGFYGAIVSVVTFFKRERESVCVFVVHTKH